MKDSEEISIEVLDSNVIEAQSRAEIDRQIATAKTYPRDLRKAMEKSIVIATISESAAKSCGYTLPRGGKSISGPSVHLAKIVVQQYGNMRIDAKVVAIDAKHITCQAVAHDLESNVAIRVEVKRSIVGKNGRFNDDMITVTGNAGNSIALRNAVFAVVPKDIIDAVYVASQNKILGDISDETKFLLKRTSVFDGFKNTYGISEEKVLASIGLKAIGQIKKEHLVELIGVAQAIKDGDTTVDQAFPLNMKEDSEKIKKEFTEKLEKEKKKTAEGKSE